MALFLFKLTLAWGLFALLYALLLRQETFFRANRAYLTGSVALGILLALPLEWFAAWPDETAVSVIVLPAVTVGLQRTEVLLQNWNWLDNLWIAYAIGATLALSRLSWGLFRIIRMAARGEKERMADGCILVKTTETQVPFSFFKWVFVPHAIQLSESSNSHHAMLAHERAHAQGWHSLDVLLLELLCVAFWFHPLAHWYRRALRTVHEYLADAEASRQTDRRQYGLLLIRQAQSGVSLAFVNHFFQSPLKQRLIMLTRNASPALRAWKYGLVLPVFAFLFLFACQKAVPEQPKNDQPQISERSVPDGSINTFELFDVDQPPQFPGGQAALKQFFLENIKFPEAARAEVAEGLVTVTFVVDENGAVTQVESLKSDRQDFQDEAIRVVESMPNWEPGRKDGKAVSVKFTLPIKFKLR